MCITTYHARWIAPVTSEPIDNGRILVEHGRIVSVDRGGPYASSAVDLGDAVVVPGFVNAHAHLELGFCHNRVPYRGSFVEWLINLTVLLSHENADTNVLCESIRTGLAQSLASGVTAVADIGHGRHPIAPWRASPLHTIGFLEVLGMGSRRWADHKRSLDHVMTCCQQMDAAEREAGQVDPRGLLKRIGLSPHALYSTDTTIYQEVMAYAQRSGRPLCTHLAETREECQLLAEGRGPFRDLLEMWRLWDGSFKPLECSPVAYAHAIGLLACHPLLAHVNYVSDADLDLLKQADASVVYCPRSHAFFDHEPHRYVDMLAAGINVCLGTDSLASNATVSILDELRFLYNRDTHLSPSCLLALATLAGARALKLLNEIGSLEPGKRADFVVIPLDHKGTDTPLDDVLSSCLSPVGVYVGGRLVDPRAFDATDESSSGMG